MAHTTTRRWMIPLTALLLVNAVLVGIATRHVGFAAEPPTAVGDASARIKESPLADAQPANSEPSIVSTATTTEDESSRGWDATAAVTADDSLAGPSDWTFDEAAAAESHNEIAGVITLPAQSDASSPATPANAGSGQVVVKQPQPQPATTTVEPTGETAPPIANSEPQPNDRREYLIFVNPPTSGGVVHFVTDGEVTSLEPGELLRLPANDERRIQFHRGDDFGDAEHRLQFGVFAFAVSDNGWTLGEVEVRVAARLLKICRPTVVED